TATGPSPSAATATTAAWSLASRGLPIGGDAVVAGAAEAAGVDDLHELLGGQAAVADHQHLAAPRSAQGLTDLALDEPGPRGAAVDVDDTGAVNVDLQGLGPRWRVAWGARALQL